MKGLIKRTIFVCAFIFISYLSRGQSFEPPRIPTSPKAEALQKYGDYNINYSTGTPDISIPFYEIDHRGYKIPLVFKYMARPLKPGYNYDVFGYGWTLTMNGSVSRTIEYEPDELNDFTLEVPVDQYYNLCAPGCLTFGNYAHDKFSVVLPNGSAFDFIMDNKNGIINYLVSEGRNVKINYAINNSQIVWFTIIDEEGVKYTFDGSDTNSGSPYYGQYVSWQLSRIDLPHTSEPILFSNSMSMQGENGKACPEPILNFGHTFTPGGPWDVQPHNYYMNKSNGVTPYYYNMKLTTEISFGPEGKSKVRLLYRNPNNSNYNYVERIIVLENDTVIKDIRTKISLRNLVTNCATTPLAQLDSIIIVGSDTESKNQKYGFNYSSVSMFGATDHWGNLNAAPANTMPNFKLFFDWNPDNYYLGNGVIPQTKTSTELTPFGKYCLSNNNPLIDYRKADEPYGHGVLHKIVYPSGGYALFEYENHRFLSQTDSEGNYIHNSANFIMKSGGGFRIVKIDNFSSEGVRIGRKNYRYGKTYSQIPNSYGNAHSHNGLGIAVVDPSIVTYMGFSSVNVNIPMRNMVLGLDPSGQNQSFMNPFHLIYMQGIVWSWDLTFSATNFRNILNGRPAVLYEQVSVYEGDVDDYAGSFPLGKTVYEYDLKGYYPTEPFFEQLNYFGNTLSYIPRSFQYNKLISKIDYQFNLSTNTFKKVKSEVNSWSWNYTSSTDYQYSNPFPPGHAPQWTTISEVFVGKPSYVGLGRLESKITKDFNTEGDSIARFEQFSYNSRNQKIGEDLVMYNYEYSRKRYEYPQASLNGPTPIIIQNLLAKNIISPVIKSSHSLYHVYSQQDKDLSGSKIDYNTFGSSSMILPSKSYRLEVSSAGSEFVFDKEIISYSVNGNPLEIALNGGLNTVSYLWDYGDRYLIAEVKNVIQSDIAYTSFESNGKGNWNFSGNLMVDNTSPTGNKSYNLSGGSITKALVANKKYVISYWQKNSIQPLVITGTQGLAKRGGTIKGWTYFEHIISGITAITLNGSSIIDELRLYPIDSEMTTYTYEPLVGMTSSTDAKGQTTYYEYDGFQRLKTIRNSKGDILKSHDYHYGF